MKEHLTFAPWLVLLPAWLALGACSEGSKSNASQSPEDRGEPSQDVPPAPSTCSSPSNLEAAYADLPNTRPCWSWLDAQAAELPRVMPTFWKTLYFDTLRFDTGTPADHTAETGAYQDELLANHPWITLAPAPPIAPPWAHSTPPHAEVVWPFSGSDADDSGSDLDEKMRGIATSVLYARSKGVATRISIMLPTGWNSGIEINDATDFRAFLDDTVAPQIAAFAKMAERVHSEYMGILSIEADGLVGAFSALESLNDSERLALVQEYLDVAAAAIESNFSGTSISAATVNYLDQTSVDWTELDYSGYDQLGLTMSVPCTDAPTVPVSLDTQLSRVEAISAANPGKPWSIVELQVPYAICADRPGSFAAFRTALDAFTGPAPVGLGLDLAPVETPNENIDAVSLSEMAEWLSTK